MKRDVMKATIKNVASYKGAGGKLRFLVTADIGKFSCEDAEIAEKLSATKGAPICIEVDDKGLIIGILDDATPTPEAVDETMPFPEEAVEQSIPSDTKPAAQPKTQSAPPKAEPTAPKAANPAPPSQSTQKDIPKAAAKQETPAKKAEPKTPAPAPLATSECIHTPIFAPNGAYAFPLLECNEVEVRVGQISDKGASFLLYKDARCDQKRLDRMFGPGNWKVTYRPSPFNNAVICTVSVLINGEWISKEDVGVSSPTEPEKGAFSDAFKRAMVVWGSGRELYSAPTIWIPADKLDIRTNAKGKPVLYEDLRVTEIGYDAEREINRLAISGKKGVIFQYRA